MGPVRVIVRDNRIGTRLDVAYHVKLAVVLEIYGQTRDEFSW